MARAVAVTDNPVLMRQQERKQHRCRTHDLVWSGARPAAPVSRRGETAL